MYTYSSVQGQPICQKLQMTTCSLERMTDSNMRTHAKSCMLSLSDTPCFSDTIVSLDPPPQKAQSTAKKGRAMLLPRILFEAHPLNSASPTTLTHIWQQHIHLSHFLLSRLSASLPRHPRLHQL
mmetsp:Transcript_19622/g.54693  ORF Transcript_19622/g.54693 Transcript_19622/m.54693 type:complete len:124 (-) Transcript_19622:267-638(-)